MKERKLQQQQQHQGHVHQMLGAPQSPKREEGARSQGVVPQFIRDG